MSVPDAGNTLRTSTPGSSMVSPFRLRGGEITRVEAFSDAVFAFAVTLLVVSLEVPRSFEELTKTMSGFPAFGLCLAMLVWLWYEHVRFFRRYGLQDGITIVINGVLLFVVLFYVYPLKFLFSLLSSMLFGLGGNHPAEVQSAEEVRKLMVIYGAGFVAVFVLFALLHARALKQAATLGLSDSERFDTRSVAIRHCLSAGVGLVSIGLALLLPARLAGIAGFSYCLLGIVHTVWGRQVRRNRRRMAMIA
jgi:hypothetical protein